MRQTMQALTNALTRRRGRRATLPWDDLEAEAVRQGCSPADIFFDRAGVGVPADLDETLQATAGDEDEQPAESGRVPWRGLDPRPRTGTRAPG